MDHSGRGLAAGRHAPRARWPGRRSSALEAGERPTHTLSKRHGLGAVLCAKALLLSGFRVFDVERAAELAAVEDEATFHRFRLFVRSYETERGFGCISYTKRAANPVVASDCRVLPE